MSKAPPGKQNMWQTILLMVTIYLATMLMCNRPQGPGDLRTSAQVLGDASNPAAGEPPVPKPGEERALTNGTLYWADAGLLHDTAGKINGTFQSKIDAEEQAKKLTPAQAQDLRMQGTVLVADAQFKYGLAHKDSNVMRLAFNTLSGWERKHRTEPLWTTTTYHVPPTLLQPERFPWRDTTANALYDHITDELSSRNKVDLTYGVFPGYQIIDALVGLTGKSPGFSYAFACFLLALIVRTIIYPVAQRQLMWGRKMQQLAPLIKEIREQYTDKKTKQVANQAEFQQETMKLYKEYGVNPMAGCLPALVQFPLFITVYQFMLHYQFEFQKGSFLWINRGTSAATNGFFAPNLGLVDYTLIVIYGITMITSTLLMPVSDPTQAKQQKLMGVGIGLMFTVFMFTGAFPVPAAFVLYWTFTNLLATAQSLRAYRLPVPPLTKVNTPTGGVFPMPAANPNGNGKAAKSALPKSTGTPAKHKPKKRK